MTKDSIAAAAEAGAAHRELERRANAISEAVEREGWAIFISPNGWQLEGTAMMVFKSDKDVWLHVWREMMGGSELHRSALRFIADADEAEFARIMEYVGLAEPRAMEERWTWGEDDGIGSGLSGVQSSVETLLCEEIRERDLTRASSMPGDPRHSPYEIVLLVKVRALAVPIIETDAEGRVIRLTCPRCGASNGFKLVEMEERSWDLWQASRNGDTEPREDWDPNMWFANNDRDDFEGSEAEYIECHGGFDEHGDRLDVCFLALQIPDSLHWDWNP